MVLGKLPVPGRPTILITVGQGPTALAVGAGGGLFGHFYSHLFLLSSFSLSLGDGPIWTEILSQRAVKPKTTNQPTSSHADRSPKQTAGTTSCLWTTIPVGSFQLFLRLPFYLSTLTLACTCILTLSVEVFLL